MRLGGKGVSEKVWVEWKCVPELVGVVGGNTW